MISTGIAQPQMHVVHLVSCYKVMKTHGLLRKPQARTAEVYQAAKLWELLPKAPNELWQMDVTYIHIPGHGWWYAVTVIDYYSRSCTILDVRASEGERGVG